MSSDTAKFSKGTTVLQYLLFTFTIITIAISAYVCFSSAATTFGKTSAIENQLCDIGSAVSSDVMTIVIFLPYGGKINYTMTYLPPEVAGEYYSVELNINRSTEKESIVVSSGDYSLNLKAGGIMWEVVGGIVKVGNEIRLNISRTGG